MILIIIKFFFYLFKSKHYILPIFQIMPSSEKPNPFSKCSNLSVIMIDQNVDSLYFPGRNHFQKTKQIPETLCAVLTCIHRSCKKYKNKQNIELLMPISFNFIKNIPRYIISFLRVNKRQPPHSPSKHKTVHSICQDASRVKRAFSV